MVPARILLRPGILERPVQFLAEPQIYETNKICSFRRWLILAIRGETVSEVENFSNLELSKIKTWPKSNEISFNEEKSKIMLIWMRKRKEVKEIKVYLHNKLLEQVTTMKYLGVIIDNKFKFSKHTSYTAERCTKLIHSLSKSGKLSWRLKHEALKTIYKGAI
jgi:ATP-dependent Clp protease adapter protein ClpS